MPNGLATWVYRDGRRRRNGHALLTELAALVRDIRGPLRSRARRSAAADALVACGELEAALADVGHRSAVFIAAESERIAEAVLGEPFDTASALAAIEGADVPGEIEISTQEGCAFYGLHPSSYARATGEIPACDRALVVGVRTIGATLSAMVTAALRARGAVTTRCTVRPWGHPYDRVLELDPVVATAVASARADGAMVLVVDEGPGLSGSTFLAVAERLVRAGIAERRIILMASTEFDAERLAATDAAARFRRFRVLVAPVDDDGPMDGIAICGGAWRAHAFDDESRWPAVFARAERKKVLVDGGARLVKFEGLGGTGRAAAARGRALFEAGFAAPACDEGGGWLSYAWEGVPCAPEDVDRETLDRLAAYCARRPALCPPSGEPEDLVPMIAKNLEVLGFPDLAPPPLEIVRPATVDGRMAPHEWLRERTGQLLKCDGIAHGDDHFFPGPTDIAWDLAGAIVEWRLSPAQRARLLERYEREAGDDLRGRIDAWSTAYVTFRAALTALALEQCAPSDERRRLERDLAFYRSRIAGAATRE